MITKFSPIPEGFFAEQGLSSTSADHIANLAKHCYESVEEKLNNVGYVSADIQIIGSDAKNAFLRPSFDSAEETLAMLNMVSECKGFIAFLREAIKAKESLDKEVAEYTSEELASLEKPMLPYPLTEDSIVEKFSIKDRERYYTLGARAATIGKFIHLGGPFAEARKKAFEATVTPTSVGSSGFNRDTVIITRSVALPVADIDAIMSSLQKEHRKVEAELNGIKHSIEKTIKDDMAAKTEEYKAAMKEYDKKRDELSIKDTETRMARKAEIEALKIVVPNRYKALYESLIGD